MIDIHTHVLPKMDDGSKSIKESVAMLRCIQKEGIDFVVATPHFYAHKESIHRFLKRRAYSAEYLFQSRLFQEVKLPEVLLGAEVTYFSGISGCDDLELLALEHSDIILLELPFCKWDSEMIREIQEIQNRRNLQVMIAHLERYLSIRENRKYIDQLLEMDVLIQISTGAFSDRKVRRKAIQWGKLGCIDVLGSDAHNMSSRKPNWKDCLHAMDKYGIVVKM